jgi:hypothetical protein
LLPEVHDGKDKKEIKQSGILAGAYITMVWEWLDPVGNIGLIGMSSHIFSTKSGFMPGMIE